MSAAAALDLPDVSALRLPADREGPVFAEPWQAQVFALTVSLHRAGHFSWREWTEYLGRALAGQAQEQDYYRCWLAALERMVCDKAPALADELVQRRAAIAQQAPGHDHHARRAPIRIA